MTMMHVGLAIAGAVAVALPIIIHILFRQRRKPIEWGAMRFLLEAYRRSRHRMRLEQWLLLAVRCLIVGLLGLALARPLLNQSGLGALMGGGGGGRIIYLIIDNGLASTVMDAQGHTALDRHKQTAQTIIQALNPSDRIAVLTTTAAVSSASEAKKGTNAGLAFVDPPAVDHEAVGRMIQNLMPTEAPSDIPAALSRCAESLQALKDDPSPAIVYLMSDFFTGSADLSRPLKTSFTANDLGKRSITLVAAEPAADSISNIQVTSLQAMRSLALSSAADLSGQFVVHLRRVGDVGNTGVSTLRLSIDQTHSTDGIPVNWAKGESETKVDAKLDVAGLSPGEHVVTASIDRDALSADNRAITLLDVRDELHVAVIDRREFGKPGSLDQYPSGSWFRRALNPGQGSEITVDDVDPSSIDAIALKRDSAAILARPDLVTKQGWDVLASFVDGGGLLWIVPAEKDNVAIWPDAAMQALGLKWTFAREVVDETKPNDGQPTDANAPDSGKTDSQPSSSSVMGVSLAQEQPQHPLLSLLTSELPMLTQPVQVFKVLPVVEGVDSDSVVLKLANSQPWFIAGSARPGSGLVLYLASATQLQWTSLPAKPFMVALVHEAIRQGLGLSQQSRIYHPGDLPSLSLPGAVTRIVSGQTKQTWSVVTRDTSLLNKSSDEKNPAADKQAKPDANATTSTTQPVIHIRTLDRPIGASGVYLAQDDKGETLAQLCVNVDPNAARTEAQSAATVSDWLRVSGKWSWFNEHGAAAQSALPPGAASVPKATDLLADNKGSHNDIGKWLLLAVLALALTETLLARLFSHAYRSDFASNSASTFTRRSREPALMSSFAQRSNTKKNANQTRHIDAREDLDAIMAGAGAGAAANTIDTQQKDSDHAG